MDAIEIAEEHFGYLGHLRHSASVASELLEYFVSEHLFLARHHFL